MFEQEAALYLNGNSARMVASVVGAPYSTVRYRLYKAGVLRTHRDAANVGVKKGRVGKTWLGKRRIFTDEHRAAIGRAHKGMRPCLGRKYSAATIEKMRESAKRRCLREGRIGKGNGIRRPVRITRDEALARARLRRRMKCMIHRVLKMPRSHTGKTYEALLGYDKRTLRSWIESQFIDGMGWSIPGSFHIDHVVPIAAFTVRGINDPRIVNALVNLQVLTREQNQQKHARYDMANFDRDYQRIVAGLVPK